MRKMKVLTEKMETMTLIAIGRLNALCIKCMKLIVKYFYQEFYSWGVIL